MITRLFALLLAAILLTASAGANPLPNAWVFVHVHSGTDIIGTCEEVIQFTSATGVLTFDLFLWPSVLFFSQEELGLGEASGEFEWPATWEFVETSLPQGVAGEITSLEPNRYSIDVTWPSCPTQTPERPLFHIARFRLNVTDEGMCRIGGPTCLWKACYPELMPGVDSASGVPAWAGACSDCPWPCGQYGRRMSYGSGPGEEFLDLQVEAGKSITGEIPVSFPTSGAYSTNPVFDATEPYLTVEATLVSPAYYSLEVTADASSLAPGEYLDHIRTAAESCTWCCPVNLTVLPATAVESGGDAPRWVVNVGPRRAVRLGPDSGSALLGSDASRHAFLIVPVPEPAVASSLS